jgi:hypothetical protein
MTAAQNPDPDGPRTPFGLVWAIKRSFVQYVRGMPDGHGSVSDGADPVEPDMILFPVAQTPSSPVGRDADHCWSFRGDVQFRGHGGMLFVRIAAPQLTVRGMRAQLTIEDPYARAGAERVPLVELHLERGPGPEGAEVWLGSDVRLTQPGAALFNDVYPAGELFEQLSVVLPLGGTGERGTHGIEPDRQGTAGPPGHASSGGGAPPEE